MKPIPLMRELAQAEIEQISGFLGKSLIESASYQGQLSIIISRENFHNNMKFLKHDMAFDLLTNLTAVDNLNYPDYKKAERFAIIYELFSTTTGRRLRIKVLLLEEHAELSSVVDIWKSAIWQEREVYDLFGIDFIGHPDLRRILMPDYFEHHPLRKDYPLEGLGERDNFEKVY